MRLQSARPVSAVSSMISCRPLRPSSISKERHGNVVIRDVSIDLSLERSKAVETEAISRYPSRERLNDSLIFRRHILRQGSAECLKGHQTSGRAGDNPVLPVGLSDIDDLARRLAQVKGQDRVVRYSRRVGAAGCRG